MALLKLKVTFRRVGSVSRPKQIEIKETDNVIVKKACGVR